MNAALVSTIGELRKINPEELVNRISEGFKSVFGLSNVYGKKYS